MGYKEWKLTDKEISELRAKGGNLTEAQEAKKRAYVKEGSKIMEYTKGEWYWEYNDQMHHNLRSNSTHPSGAKEDKHILFISPDFLGEDSLANDADAHLIAAAPDLYEALETTRSWFEEMKAYIPLHGHTLSKILQALAKAEGR